ncbi:glycosyltransferase [Paludisphaera mucosa]|uniref:Glycosyltransferase n=1 Tax=Paludisphaera mucosa TaxID=3030827 RepID=A0ABT6F862_9BACT|nr:glycosyltransferase [Paludisphaera mucosa]MDG3003619.1 glycosyltransferase [Paludisphaera mucosa]
MRAVETCPHHDAIAEGGPACRLVAEILGAEAAMAGPVGADACRACCAGPTPDARRPGPVVASLVARAADAALRAGGVPGCDLARAAEVKRWAGDQLLRFFAPTSLVAPPRSDASMRGRPSVAIVIPCHDYGRFLGEAIESVLAQTVRPDEILILDDDSCDDTREVAARYQSLGVAYRRVAFRSVYRTRRAGLAATRSEVLCFLDADDLLPDDFLEKGLPLFDRPEIGMVYPDQELFGEESGRKGFPAFDRGLLETRNYITATSLVRRRALEIADAFREPDVKDALEDWLVWRRVADAGWSGVKHPSALRYRRHPSDQPSLSAASRRRTYFDDAALQHADVTIVTPLAGRVGFWPDYRDWLATQTWPRERCQIFLVDSSGDARFGREVRGFLADCDYPATRYLALDWAEPGLADRPREHAADAVNLICARIYNRIAREVTTPFILIVEDDILPPPGVVEKLLRSMDERTAAVAAPYRSRFHEGYVAWDDEVRHYQGGEGVHPIAGCGFGCLLLRRTVLTGDTFQFGFSESRWFDHAFCRRLRRSGWTIKIDWSQECEHRHTSQIESS